MPNKTIFDLGAHVAFDKANDIVHLWQPAASGEKDRKSTLADIISLLDTNTTFSNIPYLNKKNTFTAENVFTLIVNIGDNPSSLHKLEIYDDVQDIAARAQTDRVDGVAQFLAQNDAQTWGFRLNTDDTLSVYDLTSALHPLIIEPTTPTDTLHLAPSGVGILTASPATTRAEGGVLSIARPGSGVTTGESVGNLSFITEDGSYTGTFADGIAAEISAIAETASGSAYGMAFLTGNTAAARTEHMRLTSLGALIVGSTVDVPSTKLQIAGTDGAFLLPRLTTTERDNLTPTNAMRIYNTTTNQFEGYEAGAWINI